MTTSRHSIRSSRDRQDPDRRSEKDEEERKKEKVEVLRREDGDGAVDETPDETVESGRTIDTQHCLTPRSHAPPTSPPPAPSTSSLAGSTVELRVVTTRPGSSGSRCSSVGSRPTSSKRRSSSVAEQPPTATEPAPITGTVDEAIISKDSTSNAAVQSEDVVHHTSEDADEDRVSLKDQKDSPPPTEPPSGSTEEASAETKRCGSSSSRRSGCRPSSTKSRSSVIVEYLSEPTAEAAVISQELCEEAAIVPDDSVATENVSKDSAQQDETPVDRVIVKDKDDHHEEQTTTTCVTSNVDTATADSTSDKPQEQEQPENDLEKSTAVETENDDKPEISDQQEAAATELEPNTELTPPEVDTQVDPETAVGTYQPEMATSAEAEDERPEDSAAEQPAEVTNEQQHDGSPTTESEEANRRKIPSYVDC